MEIIPIRFSNGISSKRLSVNDEGDKWEKFTGTGITQTGNCLISLIFILVYNMYVLLFLKLFHFSSSFIPFLSFFENIEYLLFLVWHVKFNIPSSSFSSSSFFYQFSYSKWNKWGEIDFSSKNKKQKDVAGDKGGEGEGWINVIYYMMMITHWKCSIFYKIRILLYIQYLLLFQHFSRRLGKWSALLK